MNAVFIKKTSKLFEGLKKLKREAEKDKAFRVARRIHGILLNMEEKAAPEIANILHVSRCQVSLWIRKFLKNGSESLLEGYRSGRRPKLSFREVRKLDKLMRKGPVACGFSTGVWTSPLVAELIQNKFKVKYHPGHVRKLLHTMNFSVQRPKRKLARADEAKKIEWETERYPAIKKKRWHQKLPLSTKTRSVFV